MGWGTSFQCEIIINKEYYQSLSELEDKIKDLEDFNVKLEQEILMFASANLSQMTSNPLGQTIYEYDGIDYLEFPNGSISNGCTYWETDASGIVVAFGNCASADPCCTA
jgi:hypothetical protein